MNKTIAIALNTSWNIYNFRLGLLKALQEEGYKIVVIAPRDAYSEKLEEMGFEYHDIDINNKGINPIEDAKLVYAYYKLYKEIAPDVILHYTIKPNIYGSIAAGMLQIPAISNISGLGTVFLNNQLSSRIARILYKVALRVPKKVFYQNAHDRDLFVKSHSVKMEKTDLLPGSGIDTEKFKPLENTVKDREKPLQFLFIGRLIKDKGIIEYVEAARRIKSQWISGTKEGNTFGMHAENDTGIEFSILGAYYPGNPTAITEEEMNTWEDEGIVRYLGYTDDVKSAIAEADCVVLPSYREGLSHVLLEAASMAKPIIATNVPGCKEVVDDGINGYLCEAKDTNSLADQMEKIILLTEEQRLEMGRKGREKVIVEYDEQIVIDKYIEAIAQLTK